MDDSPIQSQCKASPEEGKAPPTLSILKKSPTLLAIRPEATSPSTSVPFSLSPSNPYSKLPPCSSHARPNSSRCAQRCTAPRRAASAARPRSASACRAAPRAASAGRSDAPGEAARAWRVKMATTLIQTKELAETNQHSSLPCASLGLVLKDLQYREHGLREAAFVSFQRMSRQHHSQMEDA